MIVQIYEIQTAEEAAQCLALGVDHIGMVLVPETGGHDPSLREVIRLCEETPSKTSLIPLFQDLEMLYRTLDLFRPDYVHLCEALTDPEGRTQGLEQALERQWRIRERFPEIGIARTIPIPRPKALDAFPTLDIARRLEPVSDVFLTDTWLGKEPVEGYIGITGLPCDWALAKALVLQSRIPVLLAGGLSPDNVYEAILQVGPAGADSCTQTNWVEEGGRPVRFKKDFRKVERFVREVRRAEKIVGRRQQGGC